MLALALAGCSPLIGLLVRAAGSGAGTIRAGQRVSGSTAGAPSEWDPSCGSSRGGSDRAYVFVPEQTGVYRIEVDGGYDCVVAVFDEQRNDIACNDDTGRTTHSQVEPRLEAGRRYTIVVDGYHGATGSFALSVQAVSLEGPGPPPPPPGERVLVVGARREGDTSAGADRRTPPCGSAPGSPDEAWTFTPSESGVYDIAVESDFDGVLAVYAPGASEPLACNDDASSTRASRVSARLEAGTTYEVVVDGYHGARGRYAISIGIPAPAGPSGALSVGAPVAGDTRMHADARTPSCGSRPGSPDQTWTFVPPADGVYRFDVAADYDSVLALYEGGQEIACNDDEGSTRASRIEASLRAGQTYEVVVDGYQGQLGTYRLVVSAIGAAPPGVAGRPGEDVAAVETRCAGAPLLSSGSLLATIVGARAEARTSCGDGLGGEVIYRVEAPAPAVLRVRAESDLEPVLELRAGCSQAHTVVACAGGGRSPRRAALTAWLSPGQTYFLVVDTRRPGDGAVTLDARLVP